MLRGRSREERRAAHLKMLKRGPSVACTSARARRTSGFSKMWPTFCSRRETRAQVAGEQRERVREWCGLSLHAQDRNNQSVRAKRCARIGSVRAASSCCSCRTDLQRQADGDEDVAQNGDKDAPAAANILLHCGGVGAE